MTATEVISPEGTGAPSPSDGGRVYELIRDDIISGRLVPNERLVVADLARQHRTSSNPVREALQQLRGEGFVVVEANRGARVRPIDHDFIRDIYEIEMLIEPSLTRWFVGMATEADIVELEAIEARLEANNFADPVVHAQLDFAFHGLMYDRHYNQHAAELWRKHREILHAISRRYTVTLARRASVIREHHELIACIKAQDAARAESTIARHVENSGRHILEQMRSGRRNPDRARAGVAAV